MSYASGIEESPHDLAAIIDIKDNGSRGPWDIDLGEAQFIVMAAPLLLLVAGFLVCKGDC